MGLGCELVCTKNRIVLGLFFVLYILKTTISAFRDFGPRSGFRDCRTVTNVKLCKVILNGFEVFRFSALPIANPPPQ